MIQTDKKSMGNTKHGKSGRPPHSPKFRHWQKREAEKDSVKGTQMKNPSNSVSKAIQNERENNATHRR